MKHFSFFVLCSGLFQVCFPGGTGPIRRMPHEIGNLEPENIGLHRWQIPETPLKNQEISVVVPTAGAAVHWLL